MPGLSRALLKKVVKTAFNTLGDVPTECTYMSTAVGSQPDYDLSTGEAVPNTTDYPLPQVVSVKFKEDEIDRDIAPMTDQKMLFPRHDLPANVVPKESDLIMEVADGRIWEIRRLLSDPAAVVVILHVRSTQ